MAKRKRAKSTKSKSKAIISTKGVKDIDKGNQVVVKKNSSFYKQVIG